MSQPSSTSNSGTPSAASSSHTGPMVVGWLYTGIRMQGRASVMLFTTLLTQTHLSGAMASFTRVDGEDDTVIAACQLQGEACSRRQYALEFQAFDGLEL